ncbi:hypothetical protein PIB30_011296 [Stylosanthes scabra]|uniref:Uncharacterized protein n=1 Tax=Stylosanthes scabra TaxID=79078 RepID=A0ABU6V4Q8_9FABA|nr:hypothetical protein [Stylosanthes scabra]
MEEGGRAWFGQTRFPPPRHRLRIVESSTQQIFKAGRYRLQSLRRLPLVAFSSLPRRRLIAGSSLLVFRGVSPAHRRLPVSNEWMLKGEDFK